MTSRDKDLYTHFFKILITLESKINFILKKKSNLEIITDFELASINAIIL